MRGRDFLDVAREVVAGPTEAHWRTASVNAYYALLLECRDALSGWGFSVPRGPGVHAYVRLRLTYATDPDVKVIGTAIDHLVLLRNKASYDLTPTTKFQSPGHAQAGIQVAANNLALLDAIDGDPVRQAAAIASIQP